MARQRPLTPERQLLKLIESTSEQDSLKAPAIKHFSLSLLSAGAWIGRIAFLKQESVKWFKGTGSRSLDIGAINKILGAGIFILSIYFVTSFFISTGNLKKPTGFNPIWEIPGFQVGEERGFLQGGREPRTKVRGSTLKAKQTIKSIAGIQEVAGLKLAAYYLEKVRARDIFRMDEKKELDAVKESVNVSSGKTEITQNLRLVGISWSNDPDIMIEDTKAQKTYFLKKGQVIESINAKVEAVFKDKVILSFEGVEIELK